MGTETCADPESFVIGGPTLTAFFFVVFFFFFSMRKKRIQIPLIEGHHRPVSETFRCCADDGPTWMLAWKLCDFFSGDLDQ